MNKPSTKDGYSLRAVSRVEAACREGQEAMRVLEEDFAQEDGAGAVAVATFLEYGPNDAIQADVVSRTIAVCGCAGLVSLEIQHFMSGPRCHRGWSAAYVAPCVGNFRDSAAGARPTAVSRPAAQCFSLAVAFAPNLAGSRDAPLKHQSPCRFAESASGRCRAPGAGERAGRPQSPGAGRPGATGPRRQRPGPGPQRNEAYRASQRRV